MSFFISKLLWACVAPGSLLLLTLVLALLWRRRNPRLSTVLLALAVSGLLLCEVAPVGHWALAPLEDRFPSPPLPLKLDGIVVLGGSVNGELTALRGQPAINDSAERITMTLALARHYPDARIVFTGGSGSVLDQEHREADVIGPLFESLGLEPSRLTLERDSRNTWENAIYARKLVNPQPGETWLLITSAWHMPRSVGCFRQAGWTILPYPVDYEGDARHWLDFDLSGQIERLEFAEHEWIGLVSYHLLGRTDALFPTPAAGL